MSLRPQGENVYTLHPNCAGGNVRCLRFLALARNDNSVYLETTSILFLTPVRTNATFANHWLTIYFVLVN